MGSSLPPTADALHRFGSISVWGSGSTEASSRSCRQRHCQWPSGRFCNTSSVFCYEQHLRQHVLRRQLQLWETYFLILGRWAGDLTLMEGVGFFERDSLVVLCASPAETSWLQDLEQLHDGPLTTGFSVERREMIRGQCWSVTCLDDWTTEKRKSEGLWENTFGLLFS